MRSSTARSTPVSMGADGAGGGFAAGTDVGRGGADDRVWSRAASRRAEKSSRARSASSRVMSPRFTSASVYSLRTDRLLSMRSYICGWV